MSAALTHRQHALLMWWEAQRRELPWRQTRDPWEVLVCEVMAQQTQVSRVAERWRPFLGQFPTASSLANAPVAEVLRRWTGMGYNRRALNLHRCAGAVVQQHGGRVPDSLADLLALPGIGPYTARAVLAFAFERDHGVVDTNSARVLARWAGRRLGPKEAQARADGEVPAGLAWAWNQAMLDLGSSVCTRRAPHCSVCPVVDHCAWAQREWTIPDPADGSAGVPGAQTPFDGSDRQGRGRLVEALRAGGVAVTDLPTVMGWPGEGERAERVAAGVVREGLAVRDGSSLRLP